MTCSVREQEDYLVRLMSKAFSIIIFLLSLVSCTNEITLVRVLNVYPTKVIKVIDNPSELQELNEIWASKVKVEQMKNVNFLYKLDIGAVRRLPSYRYNPDGLLQSHAMKEGIKTYKIQEPERMNKLLGIDNDDLKTQPSLTESGNSKYFVFVGEKMSLNPVSRKENERSLDSQFLAKYKILEPYRGSYGGTEIEFTVFDHYGLPLFSNYKYVLLYVVLHDGKYYHSKYQFTPLYKTKSGKWAGAYTAYDYLHSSNENTAIKPEIIEFAEPVVIDISDYEEENIKRFFPEPYYRIEGKKAVAVYGNYINELFLLKQNGVLKARGDFQ